MIVVAGWARTGTSIMFRCLQESGLNGGPQQHLTGAEYKTENNKFRVCNFLIMYHSGFKTVGPVEMPGRTIFAPKRAVVDDFFVGHPNIDGVRDQDRLPDDVLKKMGLFCRYVRNEGVDILKDPQAGFAIHEWIRFDPLFRDAKYIWTRRDPLEAAKSFIRLKIPRIPQYRGVLTTKKALKTYQLHEKVWAEALKDLNHIEVHLEDMIENIDKQAERISEFIGRPFNTSPFTEKKTYKGGYKRHKNQKTVKLDWRNLKPVAFD